MSLTVGCTCKQCKSHHKRTSKLTRLRTYQNKQCTIGCKCSATSIFNFERFEEKTCHICQQVKPCLNSEQNENNLQKYVPLGLLTFHKSC